MSALLKKTTKFNKERSSNQINVSAPLRVFKTLSDGVEEQQLLRAQAPYLRPAEVFHAYIL